MSLAVKGNNNSASKCFASLSPLLSSGLLDPRDSFVLGHAMATDGEEQLEPALATLEKVLALRRISEVPVEIVTAVYCLILERNWALVTDCLSAQAKKNASADSVEHAGKVRGQLHDTIIMHKTRMDSETAAGRRFDQWRQEREKELEKSIAFIKELQESEAREAEKRRKEIEQRNIPDCSICLQKMEVKDIFVLDLCGHVYHRTCIKEYIRSEIEARRFPLLCPQPNCKLELSMVDQSHLMDAGMKDKWDEYTFKKVIESNPDDFSYCPTPDCPYVFVWEAGKDTNDYTCPQCQQHYCLNCRCVYHMGQSCKEYQINAKYTAEDRKFVDFVKGMKFKQCPSCKYWVEKNEGCNHMTCRCGKQFCYVCGGDYPQCYCKTGQRPPEPDLPPPVPQVPLRSLPPRILKR